MDSYYEKFKQAAPLHYGPEYEVTTHDRFDGDKLAIDAFVSKYCITDLEKQFPAFAYWRVCSYIASAEMDDGLPFVHAYDLACIWFDMIWNFEIIPGGRIMYGAGNPSKVSLINCTTVQIFEDSLEGIYEADYTIGKVESRGEGVGVDITSLRPRGARVNNAARTTSGAISWGKRFDNTTATVAQNGRRGALLISIGIAHPEVPDFIKVKSDLKQIENANISLQITDGFMQAVIDDDPWMLHWENPETGESYQDDKYTAREIMRMLSEHSAKYAEPGLQFLDTARRYSNSDALGFPVVSTNACCVPADQWVMTTHGAYQVKDLIGEPFDALVHGSGYSSDGFFQSGSEPRDIYTVKLKSGRSFRATDNHRFQTANGSFKELKDIVAGDKIDLHRHDGSFYGKGTRAEGYLLGSLLGDGHITKGRHGTLTAKLEFWSKFEENPVASLANEMLVSTVKGRSDRTGHVGKFGDYYKTTLDSRGLYDLAVEYGIDYGKEYSSKIESGVSSDFVKGFLSGWFDADGTVGTSKSNHTIRLANTNLEWIEAGQRMLSRLGIDSQIYKNRRSEGQTTASMPDGKGGYKDYDVKQIHELNISVSSISKFNKLVGFLEIDKQQKSSALEQYQKKEPAYSDTVSSIELDCKELVYDVTVDEAHIFDLNGVVSHNSEQWLTHLDSCVLAHANWANLPLPGDESRAEVAHRAYYLSWFLDNVVTKQLVDGRSPLPGSAEKSKLLRRIGGGFTGLADYLARCGVTYGDDNSIYIAEQLSRAMAKGAYARSMEAGKLKGSFPAYDEAKFKQSQYVKDMIEEGVLPESIPFMRNVCNITVAPVGTGMLMVKGWANGCEPGLGYAYWRRTRISGEYVWYFVVNPFVYELIDDKVGQRLKVLANAINMLDATDRNRLSLEDEVFELLAWQIDTSVHKFSHEVDPMAKAQLIAAIQKYVDSSISVTFNMPSTWTVDQIEALYIKVWQLGLKGVSIYREDPANREPIFQFTRPTTYNYTSRVVADKPTMERTGYRPRPDALSGYTETVQADGYKFYFTYNLDSEGSLYEVFASTNVREPKANTEAAMAALLAMLGRSNVDQSFIDDQLKKSAHQNSTVRVCRLVSLALRNSVPLDAIINALESIEVPVSSYIFHLRRGLSKFKGTTLEQCPECGDTTMVVGGGCTQCTSCGYSAC